MESLKIIPAETVSNESQEGIEWPKVPQSSFGNPVQNEQSLEWRIREGIETPLVERDERPKTRRTTTHSVRIEADSSSTEPRHLNRSSFFEARHITTTLVCTGAFRSTEITMAQPRTFNWNEV
jgi:hypothetical protein